MKVKLTSSRCGQGTTADGKPGAIYAQAAGDVVEMNEVEAKRYIERGLATAVSGDNQQNLRR